MPAALVTYRECLDSLNEAAERMGEMAALLSDVADMLSHYPARYAGLAEDWPSRADVEAAFQTWAERQAALREAWHALDERDQILAGPLPIFDGRDPFKPVV